MQLAISILLVSGPALGQDPGDVRRLVEELGSRKTHYEAYRVLARTRPAAAIPLLVEALPGYPLSSQSYGVSLLGSYPRDQSLQACRRLLKCRSPFLVLCAATVLHRSGARMHVDSMLRALAEARSRTELTMMLGRLTGIAEPELQAAVRSMLKPGIDGTVAASALWYLWSSEDPDAKARVTELLRTSEGDPDLRALCAAFLIAGGETEHSAALAGAVRKGIRRWSRLESFLSAAPMLGGEAVDALVDSLSSGSGSSGIRTAARILAKHGSREAVPALRELVGHEDPRIAKAAFQALSRTSGGLQLATLRRCLGSENAELGLAAAEALRQRDDLSGLDLVLGLARKGSARNKAEAVRILGGFPVRAAVPSLMDALSDTNSLVRSYGITSLGSVLRSLFPYRRFDLATTGYSATAPASRRNEATARIRTWWKKLRRELK